MKLPKFNNPPVVETVLGVQFPEISAFSNAHFGLYWATIRDRFPKAPEDQPRIAWVNETFPYRPMPSALNLRLSGIVPQRVWYKTKTESELIQLQPDRFHFNWRAEEGEAYPSYTNNSRKFFQEYEGFESFCQAQGWERPKPCLAEVTYVNHLIPQDGEAAITLLEKALVGLRFSTVAELPSQPERATFNRVYPIDSGQGRLYVEAALAQRREKTEIVVLKLTARVNLPTGGSVPVAGALQKAHDWVVGGFAAVTCAEIQRERWERIE